ncbi:hypothetical protein LCGC14_1017540 [marine sediment metagenome]|uniref:Sulfotransferase domain-containing protein n=1 Tax=marine sediment metagenome TaxID=412755 RepID=A0A0F9MYF0_9ZZZZ
MAKKIFIHLPKNAGSSIKRFRPIADSIRFIDHKHLLSANYHDRFLAKMREIKEARGAGHARWRDIAEQLTSSHQCFAVARNPWDRVVSRYCFAKLVIRQPHTKWTEEYADTSSLESFLEERHKWGGQEFLWFRAIKGWFNQLEHVVNNDGEVACDILRFENLNVDIKKYFNITQDIKAHNVTNMEGPKKILRGESYMKEYTPATIQIVADWYKNDIDHWGFDFDTGATKNYWNVDR